MHAQDFAFLFNYGSYHGDLFHMDKGIIFFCLDTKETKNQGTGLLLGSEKIHLLQFHTNRTISPPPEPLFCR